MNTIKGQLLSLACVLSFVGCALTLVWDGQYSGAAGWFFACFFMLMSDAAQRSSAKALKLAQECSDGWSEALSEIHKLLNYK